MALSSFMDDMRNQRDEQTHLLATFSLGSAMQPLTQNQDDDDGGGYRRSSQRDGSSSDDGGGMSDEQRRRMLARAGARPVGTMVRPHIPAPARKRAAPGSGKPAVARRARGSVTKTSGAPPQMMMNMNKRQFGDLGGGPAASLASKRLNAAANFASSLMDPECEEGGGGDEGSMGFDSDPGGSDTTTATPGAVAVDDMGQYMNRFAERMGGGGRGEEEDIAALMAGGTRPTLSVERLKLNKEFPPQIDAMGREVEGPCFACTFARNERVPKVASRGFEDLALLVQSVDSGTCRVMLANEIALYYEEKIRQPGNRRLRDGERSFPEWSVRSIFFHYFTPMHGRNDARASVAQRTRVMELLAYTLSETGLFATNLRNQVVVDADQLDLFLKVNRELNMMHKMDLSKLHGSGSNMTPPVQNTSQVLMGANRTYGQKPRSALM